jgi:hypothetical protein
MQLRIDQEIQKFVPIKDFRQEHQVSYEFGIAMFEPKDYAGLGRVDNAVAGAELNELRHVILDSIPTQMSLQGWLDFLPHLSQLFQNMLAQINPEIGLRESEIDHAVAGFTDVCHALVYAMIRARSAGEPMPNFEDVYANWLNNSVRVSNNVHSYINNGEVWAVQVVNHAYGRAGLVVWTDNTTHYIYDNILGCPVEGYMAALLKDVTAQILAATE